MRNESYLGLLVVAIVAGAFIVFLGVLPDPGSIVSGLSTTTVGGILLLVGAMGLLMFAAMAYMRGALTLPSLGPNASYLSLVGGFTLVGAVVVLAAPLPTPASVLAGVPVLPVGGLLLLIGVMGVMMFAAVAYMRGALHISTGPSAYRRVDRELRDIVRRLAGLRRIPEPDAILRDLDEARKAIDVGAYERADTALHRIEQRLEQAGYTERAPSRRGGR